MKKIRVLQFPIAGTKGGITQYILTLWNNIDKDKIQMDFLTFSRELDFEDELVKKGSKVYHFSCYPEDDEEKFSKEFNEILSRGYDVIELHTSFWKSTIMERIAKEKGVKKIIIHAHSTGIIMSRTNENKDEAEKRHNCIRKQINQDIATDFWACSKEAGEWLFGDNVRNIKIINNAIDVCRFKYDEHVRNVTRKGLGIEDKFVLGHVGRFEYEKNHKFILDIFEQIYNNYRDTRLLLVGEGTLYKEIYDIVCEKNMKEAVIFLGQKENPEKWLQAMDVFVFPSWFEATPIALLEAQCTGLKCVCSEYVPDEGIVTDNVYKIRLSNKKEWIKKITMLRKGYVRKSEIAALESAGYSIKDKIIEVQKEYLK